MGALRPVHIVILVLVVVILFGFKKLPDAARSLGRSMRIFKSEVEEMKKDGQSTPSAASGDTVKGETFNPTSDSVADPVRDPTKDPAPEPERHRQTPT
jgi:sec-independent protein translocase protein TatA